MTASYINLRKKQVHLARLKKQDEKYLLSFLDSYEANKIAETLASKYFPKSIELDYFKDIVFLYKLFLLLSPLSQNQKYGHTVDILERTFISWLRRYIAGSPKRSYVSIDNLERVLNYSRLENGLNQSGINSPSFIKKLFPYFKRYYSKDDLIGSLANRIFDPFVFFNSGTGFRLRKNNEIFRLEKDSFPNSINVLDAHVISNKYIFRIKISTKNNRKYLYIKLSDKYISKFKSKFTAILSSDISLNQKFKDCNLMISMLTSSIMFLPLDYDWLNNFSYWIKDVISKNDCSNEVFNKLPETFIKLSCHKNHGNKMYFPNNHFMWNIKEVKKDEYLTFYSPFNEV